METLIVNIISITVIAIAIATMIYSRKDNNKLK